jgi:hypothetical protein
MARPSLFNQPLADAICDRLADGESLAAICRDPDMPARSTVFKWLAEHSWFSDRYASAREAQADTLFDQILEIVDEQPGTTDAGATDTGMVADKRLRFDARRWVASKLAPKKYGEKQHIEHSGDISVANTILESRKRSGRG